MGQYYKFIILDNDKKNDKEVILLVLEPREYDEGSKLMEHSYLNTDMMNTVEYLISKYSNFYKSRIIWAGDYAEEEIPYINEDDEDVMINLYRLADNYSSYNKNGYKGFCKYIVNHTQKLYVNKENCHNNIHPLPLLISEGNGSGGGDYHGHNKDLCGKWSRDVISMEETIPDGYDELVCDFYEY